jgi:hypothetical protein
MRLQAIGANDRARNFRNITSLKTPTGLVVGLAPKDSASAASQIHPSRSSDPPLGKLSGLQIRLGMFAPDHPPAPRTDDSSGIPGC